MQENHADKVLQVGHWEIHGGVISPKTILMVFHRRVIEFEQKTNCKVLCNKRTPEPMLLEDFGKKVRRDWCSDYVYYLSRFCFQIAAREDSQLYEYCRIAREIFRVSTVLLRWLSSRGER